MKRIGLILLSIIFIFLVFILAKTVTFSSNQLLVGPVPAIDIDEASIGRLQKALRLKTISYENASDFDSTGFEAFNTLLTGN